MATTEVRVARPKRQWGCRHGTPSPCPEACIVDPKHSVVNLDLNTAVKLSKTHFISGMQCLSRRSKLQYKEWTSGTSVNGLTVVARLLRTFTRTTYT